MPFVGAGLNLGWQFAIVPTAIRTKIFILSDDRLPSDLLRATGCLRIAHSEKAAVLPAERDVNRLGRKEV